MGQLTHRWALAIRALRLPKQRCFLCGHDASLPPAVTGCGLSLPLLMERLMRPWLSEVRQELAETTLSWDSCLCSAVLAERKHYCTAPASRACSWPAILTTMEVSPSSSPHLISSLPAVTSP